MTDYQWMSHMAAQTYPLADEVSGLSLTAQLLPNFLLLDMHILIPGATGSISGNNFYVCRVQDAGGSLSIYIGYSGTEVAVCSGIPKTLTMTQPSVRHWYTLAGISDTAYSWAEKISGSVCVGPTQQYTNGNQSFSVSNARLNRQVVSILGQMTYLQAIRVGTTNYTGIVDLVAGDGVTITADTSGDTTTLTFNVDQTYVSQLVTQEVTEQLTEATGAVPITSINGIKPDAAGNISIQGLDCVSVSGQGRGALVIKNPCSKPCCDATNIQSTQIALAALKQQQAVLQGYFANQANTINYMQANLSTLMNQR